MVREMDPVELKVLEMHAEEQKAKKSLEAKAEDEKRDTAIIDDFIAQCDDPNYFRTVVDKVSGEKVVLSDKDLDVIHRIRNAVYPDTEYDPYEPYVDFFTHEVSIHPVMNRPEPKAAFIPSLSEKRALTKLVALIRSGKIKPYKEKTKEPQQYNYNFDLWATDGDIDHRRHRAHIPAPKAALPSHAESYNPPPEYLLTKDDITKWENQTEEERDQFFLPQRFPNLRSVPAYSNIVRERFDRCLELYMCSRQRIRRANVDPESLIPKLPRPRDLAPFPSVESIVYKGHTEIVKSVSVEPQGQFIVSGSEDGTVKIWEILNGRCWRSIKFDSPITLVSWCPCTTATIIAVATEKSIYMMNSLIGDIDLVSDTDMFFSTMPTDDESSKNQENSENVGAEADDKNSDNENEEKTKSNKQPVTWNLLSKKVDKELYKGGCRLKLEMQAFIEQLDWRARGDYFVVAMPSARNLSVVLCHLPSRQSQYPFKKGKHLFNRVAFHPTHPKLFAADDRNVHIYDLAKKETIKKLTTGLKNTSCIAIHPKGDNLLIGSYDPRLVWFDIDLSTKPYKTMRYHKHAIRSAAFHSKYPLFASASDDAHVIVSHGMVYDDLTTDPLIVPLKVLHGHEHSETQAVTDCKFHHNLPWIFTSGFDKTVRLFT